MRFNHFCVWPAGHYPSSWWRRELPVWHYMSSLKFIYYPMLEIIFPECHNFTCQRIGLYSMEVWVFNCSEFDSTLGSDDFKCIVCFYYTMLNVCVNFLNFGIIILSGPYSFLRELRRHSKAVLPPGYGHLIIHWHYAVIVNHFNFVLYWKLNYPYTILSLSSWLYVTNLLG